MDNSEKRRQGVESNLNAAAPVEEPKIEVDVEVEGGTAQQCQGQANSQVAMWQFADKACD